ncbi:hypothetical protein NPIL_400571 [Nephila pilipes]|uniref:Uncharacterized protein n=1 Tax=Nephila pilipes TaxID=299642 RepID=A0A8X6P4T5_NEPPI|nr:hypothetical protein NPIL_400571 [Nephila pilipes]
MEHNMSLIDQLWPFFGQSLASKSLVVDSRDLNLVFGHMEATHNNDSFLVPPNAQQNLPGRSTGYITLFLTRSCRMWPISHPLSVWPRLRRWKFDPSCFFVLIGVAPKHRASF